MDPFVALIILVSLVFAGYMGKKGMDLEKMKLQAKHGNSDKSMAASELKGLIRQAVEEANAPLHERILELESRLHEYDGPRDLAGSRTRELSAFQADGER